MNIVILGMGTVGQSIAEMLTGKNHSVTIVDRAPDICHDVAERLDVHAKEGEATNSSLMFQIGIASADLCIAVTDEDTTNLIACSMAKAMGAKRTICRVLSEEYQEFSTFDYQRHFKIDRLLSIENLTALELATVISNPESVAVENFARGMIEMQEIEVEADTKAVGVALRDMHFPPGVRVGSITHKKSSVVAGPDDEVEVGDRVTLIGTHEDVDQVKRLFEHINTARQSIVIGGGGRIGYHLARILEGPRNHITIFERDSARCAILAEQLPHTTVLHGDATQLRLLEEERIGQADVYVAAMGDDEDNIISAVEASELGTQKTMSVIQRTDYTRVVKKLGIDRTVSPREVAAKQVLSFLTYGPVLSRTSFSGIEVIEVEVQKDSPATKYPLQELPLPEQCLIAGIMRDDYVRVANADDAFKIGDVVVALVQADNLDEATVLFSTQ